MTSTNCLNCEKELTDKFCAGCGQKADTHRISFQHFIFHDLLHGTFHIDKGMLFTARQSLTRPGKAALDYISGKRIRYYNVFYLVLITLGLLLFVRHFYDELLISQIGEAAPDPTDQTEANKALDQIYTQRSKILIFLFVPLSALNSFILFRRKRLNLSEHAIIAGMVLLGMLLISMAGHLIYYINLVIPFSGGFATVIDISVVVLTMIYLGYAYINAFRADYSGFAMGCRIALMYLLMCVEVVLLLAFLIGLVSHWTYQGTFNLNPMG
ncbi:DUF3667 domain-containing protein [Flavobacterium pallidum]|uniref:DUF3667 domain-containing protein n=1 Tax=Flavobacterium pallidum TaxID=2172098 RepID=A0A2S1SI47_9FLAO|nr:DUF3667 domain-containing protein [Flavobacterium pallidum]AWI26088.1 hypothetical protein HYN49_09365 [Flavobacterium pallidum]